MSKRVASTLLQQLAKRLCSTDAGQRAAPWFQAGLSFKCTQCGKCCTGGPDRVVTVNDREADSIAAHLGVSREVFNSQYLQDLGDGLAEKYRLRKNQEGNACIFLKGKHCSVYAARPIQCQTYPFWGEHVMSLHDWEAEAKRCEGIKWPAPQGKEDLVPTQAVMAEVILQEMRHGELHNMKYSELRELLDEVAPELVDEFAEDFWAAHERTCIYESDRYRVLDTRLGDPSLDETPDRFRCLVARSMPGYVQTQCELVAGADGTLKPSHSALRQAPHRALVLALAVRDAARQHQGSASDESLEIAVIGAGGCALPAALCKSIPTARVAAVDICREALQLAQSHFGVETGPRLALHEADGVRFLQAYDAREKYDVVLVDVAVPNDNDISAPPDAFLEPDFLVNGLCASIRSGGMAAIHVAGGMPAAARVARALQASFHQIHAISMPGATVVYAFPRPPAEGGSAAQPPALDVPGLLAAVERLPGVAGLCGKVVRDLKGWSLDAGMEGSVRASFGFGWYTPAELLAL